MDAFGAAHVEAVGGKALGGKLVGVGIGPLVIVYPCGDHLGGAAAFHAEVYAADDDVLDEVLGLAEAGDEGALAVVVGAGDVLDDDAAEGAGGDLGGAGEDAGALADAEVDRGAGVVDHDVFDEDVLHDAAVDRGEGDAGGDLRGVFVVGETFGDAAEDKVAGVDAAEVALGVGADFEGVAGGVEGGVLDQHVLGGAEGGALEAEGVVLGVDEAVAHDDAAAAVDVDAVVVMVGLVLDLHALEDEVFAVEVVLQPAGGVFEGDVFDHD